MVSRLVKIEFHIAFAAFIVKSSARKVLVFVAEMNGKELSTSAIGKDQRHHHRIFKQAKEEQRLNCTFSIWKYFQDN